MNKYQEVIATRLVKHHDGQMYGSKPYWFHLHDVSTSVADAGGDSEQVAIGWLHDIIEDTDCTYATLLDSGCSLRVIDAVSCITKVDGETYKEYIAKVRSNPDALLVKKHDTLCNLTQSLKEGDSRRIKKYAKQLLLLEE